MLVNRVAALTWIALAAIGLAACSGGSLAPGNASTNNGGPASANAPDVKAKLDDFYTKAQASGGVKVSHYGGTGSEYDEIVKDFHKYYPKIEVETVLLRGPEMIQRVQAEAASGKLIANVVSHGQTTMSTVDKQGMLEQWEGPPTASQLPEIPLTSGGVRWATTESLFGYMYNTQLVPADKAPMKKEDLLDPFWKGKGKILLEDPRANGPGLDVFTMIYEQAGQSYLEALKRQEPTFVRDRDAAPHQIARGEYAMFLPLGTTREWFDLERAAPVKVEYLRDGGSTVLTGTIAVVKNGPSLDAAKLWVSWLTSPDGQRSMTDNLYSHPALPGVAPSAGLPPFNEVNPSRRTPDQISRNNEYIEIFDKAFFK